MSWNNPQPQPPHQPPQQPPHQPAPQRAQPPARPRPRPPWSEPAAWAHAFAAVAAAFLAMGAAAWLALWLLGANALGSSTMPSLVGATVALGVGGKVKLSGAGQAGGDNIVTSIVGNVNVASGSGEVDVVMLGIGLIGSLVLGWLFLRPLRDRQVIGTFDLVAHALRVAVFTAGGLGAAIGLGTHSLPINGLIPQTEASSLIGVFDLGATAKFTTDVPSTLGMGGLWLLVTLLASTAVSTHRPLPPGWHARRAMLRPPVAGVLTVLLGAVVLGVAGAPFVALEAPGPRRMIGGMLLALPNVMWLLLTLGMGVSWKSTGGGDFTFGLPGPLGKLLKESASTGVPIRIDKLAQLDQRAWWVPVASGILLLVGGTLMALRSPARVRPWGHAWRFAVVLPVVLVVVAYLSQVHLKVAVSALFGAVEPGGSISLHPDYVGLLGFGALWGACAGLLGGALAEWVRYARGPSATGRPVAAPVPAAGAWPPPQGRQAHQAPWAPQAQPPVHPQAAGPAAQAPTQAYPRQQPPSQPRPQPRPQPQPPAPPRAYPRAYPGTSSPQPPGAQAPGPPRPPQPGPHDDETRPFHPGDGR